MQKAKVIILIILLSIVGLGAILGASSGTYYFYSHQNKEERAEVKVVEEKKNQEIYFEEEKYEPKGIVNYLVIGVDSTGTMESNHGFSNKALNDFICLVSFNLDEQTFFALPINRDTMVEINELGLTGKVVGHRYTQIDYAHSMGDGMEMSFRNTCDAVSTLLFGVEIERFIGINMSTVPLINDFVGGVEITLEEDLTILNPEWKEGATITITGDNCLKYLRARRYVGTGTQISRMNRQRVYLEALAKKIIAADYQLSNITDLLFTINSYVCMDVTYIDIADVLGYIKAFKYEGIKSIEGSTQVRNNLTEFIPDEEKLKELVKTLFYVKIEEE